MGKQLDTKSLILIVFVVLLLAGAGYLTYLIQDGSNPLGIFMSQASEEDGFIEDPEFLAQAGPTPTIAYSSTSPTLTPSSLTTTPNVSPTPLLSGAPSTVPSPSISSVQTLSPTLIPSVTSSLVTTMPSEIPTALPTTPTELPVAGVGDFLQPVALSGVLLVIISLIL